MVATLDRDGESLAQAFRFPVGRPRAVEDAAALGVTVEIRRVDDALLVRVGSRRLLHGVRVDVPGYDPDDNAFSIEPGGSRCVTLLRTGDAPAPTSAFVTAVNLTEPLTIGIDPA